MDLSPDRQAVTQLLHQWSSGNKQALDQLMPFVYDQLRKLASNCLRAERPDHTLRATALVHEAYVRLVDSNVDWQDRVHFFAVSARLLRRAFWSTTPSRVTATSGVGSFKRLLWMKRCLLDRKTTSALWSSTKLCSASRHRISERVN